VLLVDVIVQAGTEIGGSDLEVVVELGAAVVGGTDTKLSNGEILVEEVDAGEDFGIGPVGAKEFHTQSNEVDTHGNAVEEIDLLLLFLACGLIHEIA